LVAVFAITSHTNSSCHGFGPTSVSEDGQEDVSMICLGNGRETGQPDSVEFDRLGQCTASWRCDWKWSCDIWWCAISLVCNFDVMDVILPSDAECLTLKFNVKTPKDRCKLTSRNPAFVLQYGINHYDTHYDKQAVTVVRLYIPLNTIHYAQFKRWYC